MTINLGGVPIQDVRVAGVQAQRVMLGTGSTAVEVWSASVYPLTGTWGPLTIQDFGLVTWASHTITEPGSFTITHTATLSLGANAGITTPAGTVTGNPVHSNGGISTATTTVTLSVGAVVQFQTNGGYLTTASGTWSITKN